MFKQEFGNLAQELDRQKNLGFNKKTERVSNFEIEESNSEKFKKWKNNTINWEEVRHRFFEKNHTDFNSLSELEKQTIYLEYNKDILEEKRLDFLEKSGVDINDLTIRARNEFFLKYDGSSYKSRDDADLEISPEKFNEYIAKYGKDSLETVLGDPSFMLQVIEAEDVEKIEKNLKDFGLGKRFFGIFSEMFRVAQEMDILVDDLNKIFTPISGKKNFWNKDWQTDIEDNMNEFFMFSDDDASISRDRLKDSIEQQHVNSHRLKESLESLRSFYVVTLEDWNNFQYKDDALRVQEFLNDKSDIFENIIEWKSLRGVEISNEFCEKVADDIGRYGQELEPGFGRPYFPVGISSTPAYAEKEGGHINKQAGTLDLFGYLLHLDNQNIKSDLFVIDTIQQRNYELLYGLNKKDALEVANKEGASDCQMYNNYKKLFHLNNINISDFSQIEKNEEFQRSKLYISDLVRLNKFFQGAFESLVESSILNKAVQNNPDLNKLEILKLLSEYPQQEITMILSKDGVKMGHEKEQKYDILSQIISVYRMLEDNADEVKTIISKSEAKEKYNLKDIGDMSTHLRNLSMQIVSSLRFSEEYQNYLSELSELEIEYETNNDKLKKVVSRLKDLEFRIEQDKLILSDDSDFQKNRESLVDQKMKTKLDTLAILKNDFSELTAKDEELKALIKNKKALIDLYLSANSNDKDTSVILNKFRSDGFYKWQKEHILNRYSKIAEDIIEQNWFDEASIPRFYYPANITSMSFANDIENSEERMGFRKPYGSKHFNDYIYFSNINQVLIDGDGRLLGDYKILCLDEEKQLEYLNKAIKPFLIEYYINKFKDKNLAQKAFLEDFGNAKTLSDVFSVIQEKIILSHFPKQSQI